MNWLTITIIAYFIYALVFVADRILITKTFKQPVAYAFYAGLLHGAVILLIPILLFFPAQQLVPSSLADFLIDILAGVLFFVAVYFFYRALFLHDASQIVPLVGSLVPLFSLILTFSLLARYLSWQETIAFSFLLLGGMLISIKGKIKTSLSCFISGLLAAFFFGVFYTLTDYIYMQQPFFSGFIWARIGTALAALFLLALPWTRRLIFSSSNAISHKVKIGAAMIGVHGLGAGGFLMIHYAISLSHVSLINALQGVQYVFLMVIIVFLSKKFPQLLKEDFTTGALAKKFGAIFLVGLGLVILAFYSGV